MEFRSLYNSRWTYGTHPHPSQDVQVTEPNLNLSVRQIVSRYTQDQISELNEEVRKRSDQLEQMLERFEEVEFRDMTDLQDVNVQLAEYTQLIQQRIENERLKVLEDTAGYDKLDKSVVQENLTTPPTQSQE